VRSLPERITGGGDPVEPSPAEPGTDIAVHGPDGRRALGVGPDTGDAPVRDAASAYRENSATERTAEVAARLTRSWDAEGSGEPPQNRRSTLL
jgi:hypothetical protein